MPGAHDEEPWSFTIVKVQGLSYMRPEKSWRPIVTLEIDSHHHHEVVMGCDGQNPNLKSPFSIHGAHNGSKVELKVWHRSQSKKKGKKRNLVATCSHPLGELLKKQELDSKLELRLNCQTPTRKNSASKGKPQNGAQLHLRLHPPSSARSRRPTVPPLSELHSEAESCESCLRFCPVSLTEGHNPAAQALSDTLTPPLSPASDSYDEDDWPEHPPSTKPIRPFYIDTDDECTLDADEDEKRPLLTDSQRTLVDDTDPCFDDPLAIVPAPEGTLRISLTSGPLSWIAASMLPQYTEKIDVPTDLSRTEVALAAFTMYSELKAARYDSQFEAVFSRLQREWTFIGGLLVAIAAVDTAVFAISKDAIFEVDPYARNAIAASSIASGLGIACDAWFLLRYNWADLQTFIHRARDVFDSYFFFAISARVPCLCMLISAISLLGFLGRVAYNVWPEGVIVACFFVGMLMTLQFLAKGVVLFGHAARGVRGKVVSGMSWATRRDVPSQ